MTSRAEQKEKRREEILMVGLDLFIRKGFSATKISDIAKEADMSVGLLFHYFESKEKLFEELIKIGMSGPKMMMEGDQSDPLAYFETTAKQIFQFATSEPFVAKMFVLMSQASYNDGIPEAAKDLLQQDITYEHSASLMKRGQENGTIREGNPMSLTLAYWAAIQGVCEALVLYPGTPCPESDWIVDIIRRK
ncbi:MAG: transcriptional regulator, TetR family [Herbinix sp.]|jgi:AcrR family transcriptional regulator|nr:transcriptional regulator, TetR family [Herbinix sp.]